MLYKYTNNCFKRLQIRVTMATVTGKATKVFNFMAKKYDKYWDLPKEKCEIETFQADMSFPLITFTTCSV